MYIIDILYFTPPLSYASFKYFLFWKAGILKSFPRNVNKIPLSPFMHNVKREYTGYGILFQFLSQNFMNEYSFLKIWICKLQFTISWFNTFSGSVIADSCFSCVHSCRWIPWHRAWYSISISFAEFYEWIFISKDMNLQATVYNFMI